MSSTGLRVKDLHVAIDEKPILNGVTLTVAPGSVQAIMGPNGSGKSTLSYALMGHPAYEVTAGSAQLNGVDLLDMAVDQRARAGLFLAFQYPYEVEGVPLKDLIRQAYNALYADTEKQIGVRAFMKLLIEKCDLLGIDHSFIERSVNVGFSGGEKKRAEVLQLAVLQPQIAILDEIDSGLDVDALKSVCSALQKVREDNKNLSLVIITHYQRILNYITPDIVHIVEKGVISQTGDATLAHHIEQHGYQK